MRHASSSAGTPSGWFYIGAIALLAPLLGASSAAGEEACVVCQEPAAIYSCSVQHADQLKRVRRADGLLHLACIKDIARQYGHKSCAINRNFAGNCNGAIHVVNPKDAANHVIAGTSRPDSSNGAQPIESQPEAAPTKDEPKTVVELAKRTAKSTTRELKKAGDNVSKAVKSTWRCVSSLFSEC